MTDRRVGSLGVEAALAGQTVAVGFVAVEVAVTGSLRAVGFVGVEVALVPAAEPAGTSVRSATSVEVRFPW